MSNLGAKYNSATNTVSFRVFSHNATRIAIYFYPVPLDADDVFNRLLVRQGDIWEITLNLNELREAGANSGRLYYGYRAWGPNWEYHPEWTKGSELGFICDVDPHGNRFNPNKLLIDPYAREISHDPQVDRLYIDPNAYLGAYYGGNGYRNLDTGRIAPKSVIWFPETPVDYGNKPRRHLKDDVIYEVNLRGFTKADPEIAPDLRGTYQGAGLKAKYLKELGVTAVEFLPVQEFADDQNDDDDPRGDNYWGYMPINYFAPNRRYAADQSPGGPTREFKAMVKAFHDEGIKVFLDVVYNHTGEGILRRKVEPEHPTSPEEVEKAVKDGCLSRSADQLQDYQAACLLSLIGLDNRSYFFLRDQNRRYEGRGGCGGNLNYDHQVVKDLILDSLKYWVNEMGVDGFRFDLAPILTLTGSGGSYRSDVASSIFNEISQALPSRMVDFEKGVDLIAEPWGDESPIDWSDKFPSEWAVWNKTYRDQVKTALNKYGVIPLQSGDFARTLSGSRDFVGKHPWCSINYIVSHDDCNSLRNLFSYNIYYHLTEGVKKSDQISWDQGGSLEEQKKAVRNAFVLLMLAAGVPMFTGGDELFRAIPPYEPGIGQMNLVWVDRPEVYLNFENYHRYRILLKQGDKVRAKQLLTECDDLYLWFFVKQLIHFRHQHPSLRPERFLGEKVDPVNGLAELTWYRADATVINIKDWQDCDFLAFRVNASNESHSGQDEPVESIYLAYNRSPWDYSIILPPNVRGKRWYRVLDTDNTGGWMTPQYNFDGGRTRLDRDYLLHQRSILVLVEK